ncbi:MAG: DUF1002 domain-containing protein [Lachnospiraceae bacterium]|nr:DUF1002 domain-containing protein [Lachnospiraceae bacterium]
MELMGDLKDKLSKAKSKEEATSILKKADIKLSDDELDQISGGGDSFYRLKDFDQIINSKEYREFVRRFGS